MIQILVPVTFTDKSYNALTYALTLAGKLPSRVVILHCFSAYVSLAEIDEETGESILKGPEKTVLQEREQKARNELRNLCDKTVAEMTPVQKENILLEGLLEYGYPEDVIPQFGDRMGADVIVMGTKSKGETIKELLGSVTSDVIKKSVSPVLSVPVNSSVDLEKLSKILFLTDFGDSDYISLHKLIRLITPFKTQIHAVHFQQRPPDKHELRRMESFRDYCFATYRNHELLFKHESASNYIQSLEDYSSKNHITLIAMTRRRRSIVSKWFSPSITRKTLFSTDIPLLVFHM